PSSVRGISCAASALWTPAAVTAGAWPCAAAAPSNFTEPVAASMVNAFSLELILLIPLTQHRVSHRRPRRVLAISSLRTTRLQTESRAGIVAQLPDGGHCLPALRTKD